MAEETKVWCDKCQREIGSCEPVLVEFRVGVRRARRRVDLCDRCYDLLIEWIDIMEGARRLSR